MTTEELRELYDHQLRAEAEMVDADEVTRIGPLWAATFPRRSRGFLSYAAIPLDVDLDALIEAAVRHYSADPRVDHFEWKTRGHDLPADLMDRLVAHGFLLEDPETVMAGPASAVAVLSDGVPEDYSVQCATTEDAVREAEGLAGRVFGDPPERSTGQADELVDRLRQAPGSFEMWLVRAPSGDVVCSGRVDFVDGTEFAGLWGGACHAAHRGLGLYRAITVQRARSALRRGKLYLQSDCTEHSRPILERAGLIPITTTTPALWHRSVPD